MILLNLTKALEVMLVGMISVFIVLSLVVAVGYLLINLVNRWRPKQLAKVKKSSQLNSEVPRRIAVLTAAVTVATQGQGKIVSIERINAKGLNKN